MTETTIVMCDGPACTAQREGGTLKTHDWISVQNHAVRGVPSYHFCTWVCLSQFSDAKVAAPYRP